MQKSLTVLGLVILCGCRTVEPTRTVKIETDPPGMRIFYGNSLNEQRAFAEREYIGLSPCEAKIRCDEDGYFENHTSTLVHPKAVFFADPPHDATNLFPQSQAFSVPSKFGRPDKIPAAVFFDMHRK